jgi:hypothetical protein
MSSEQIESVQVILGPAAIINHALKRSYRDNLAGAMSCDNHASPVRVVVNVMAPPNPTEIEAVLFQSLDEFSRAEIPGRLGHTLTTTTGVD